MENTNLFKTLKSARAESRRRINEDDSDFAFVKIAEGPYKYFVGPVAEWVKYLEGQKNSTSP